MFKLLHKERMNTDDIIDDVVKITSSTLIDFGGKESFKKECIDKEYYSRKLAMKAALAIAGAKKEKYKKQYKKHLNKNINIEVMMSEAYNIVGILIRNGKRPAVVLDNWEIIDSKMEEFYE